MRDCSPWEAMEECDLFLVSPDFPEIILVNKTDCLELAWLLQWVKLLPVMPTSHVASGLSPSLSTSSPAPCC